MKRTIHELIRLPDDPSVQNGPPMDALKEWHDDRSAKVKRSKRRLTIMSTLATGWLPWGVEWSPRLSLCYDYAGDERWVNPEFVLCCGHTMKPKEAQEFVTHGLLTISEDDHLGRENLVITKAGRAWLQGNW